MKKIIWSKFGGIESTYYGKLSEERNAPAILEIKQKGTRNPVYILKTISQGLGFFTERGGTKILCTCQTLEEAQQEATQRLKAYIEFFTGKL